jgi:competence protein ComEA
MKRTNTLLAAVAIASILTTAMNARASDGDAGKQVVNINTATVTELAYLPGVGESRAKAIVQYRSKQPFEKVEDLMRVKGIGRKGFKNMSSYLSVQGPTTVTAKIKLAK